MRHAVLMTMYNQVPEQLELTILAFNSIMAQDIGPLDIWLINNGSTEPTLIWLRDVQDMATENRNIFIVNYSSNRSPSEITNRYLHSLFAAHDKVLGVPNDVIIPPNAYRLMAEWPRGFVSATPTDDRSSPVVTSARVVSENTPMCVMLTRKWAYDALLAKDGYYLDEGYFFYASDCDLALRMAACGIRGIQLDISFWHYCSAHWRLLPPEEGKKHTNQADRDREYFEKKWGFKVDSTEFGQRTADINFRGVCI